MRSSEPHDGQAPAHPAVAAPRSERRRWLRLALPLAGLGAAALAGVVGWRVWPSLRDRPDALQVYRQTPQGPLHLHLFLPRGQAQRAPRAPAARAAPAPVLVFFHGGAWLRGDPAQFHPQCRHFSDRGFVCASVQYRLGEVHGTTPADAVSDARAAVRHLRRQAAVLGLDPNRVAAGGGSAGGHLAASLGAALPLRDDDDDGDSMALAPVSARADALLLLNPMLDFAPGMPDHALVAPDWQALSPYRHLDAATPPTLILSGTEDREVAVQTVERHCQAVRALGQRCELVLVRGATHGFFNPHREGGRHYRDSLVRMEAFLRSLGWWPRS